MSKIAIQLAAALCCGSAMFAASTRHEAIYDPNFRMTAFDVTVPADWKFEGTYVAGSSCANFAFPVFRAYSRDGLTELRRYPRMDWTWSNSRFAGAPHPDCLNVKSELTAGEFIKLIMGVQQVAYVRDAPVPRQAVDAQQRFLAQLNAQSARSSKMLNMEPAVQRGSMAGAYGEYRNGSYTIEAHFMAKVQCIRSPIPNPKDRGVFTESCSADLRVVRAPKGKLEAVLAQFAADQVGAHENPEWINRYMQAQFARNNARLAQFRRDMARAQEIRNQQHQQFMATLQAGTDRSMANARAIANSNHAIASDWCDYALDRQTVAGPNGTAKVSSAYTHTWANASGQYYQTNDPNANPNGVLPGNWTQQQRVHGDGSR